MCMKGLKTVTITSDLPTFTLFIFNGPYTKVILHQHYLPHLTLGNSTVLIAFRSILRVLILANFSEFE